MAHFRANVVTWFLLLVLAACGNASKTSVLVDVVAGPGMNDVPEALRMFLHREDGEALFDDERLPQQGRLQPLSAERLGSVVLYVGEAAGKLELNIFATKAGARIARGRAMVEARAGQQKQVTVTLLPTVAWPDGHELLGLGPNGEPCAADEQCLSGACIDGVCCTQKQCGTCEACNLPGSAGICAAISEGESDLQPAGACVDKFACDGHGSCRKRQGQACEVNADCAQGHCEQGVCCNSACEGACETCGKVGGTGLCRPRPAGEAPDNEACPRGHVCDGQAGCQPPCSSAAACPQGHACQSGACVALRADGEACSEAGQCGSGSCVDGRCCKASCGSCMACTGAAGTCEPRKAGEQDGAPHFQCTGVFACNGRGGCGRALGQSCESDGQCSSGHCAHGVCCDSDCNGVCQNCGGGQCTPILNASDPRGCSGKQICDARGDCRKVDGQLCGSGAECASGFCVDGACCNSACDESCFSCSSGTCTLKVNTTDAQCTGGRRCDAAGLCR